MGDLELRLSPQVDYAVGTGKIPNIGGERGIGNNFDYDAILTAYVSDDSWLQFRLGFHGYNNRQTNGAYEDGYGGLVGLQFGETETVHAKVDFLLRSQTDGITNQSGTVVSERLSLGIGSIPYITFGPALGYDRVWTGGVFLAAKGVNLDGWAM